MSNTVVNAAFSKGRRKTLEWRNVQNIVVPLPYSDFSTFEFRREIVRLAAPGPDWRLEGYCLTRAETTEEP